MLPTRRDPASWISVTTRTRSVTRGHGFLEEFLARQRCRKANSLIPESARKGRILDVGCGSYPLFLLNTNFAERYGLDRVAPDDFSKQGITLIHHDIETGRLPFDGGFFDVVTMLAVFEHLDLPVLRAVLREIHRTLRPGGSFIMTTPAHWTDGILQVIARIRLVSHVEIGEHKGTYSQAQIAAFLDEAGFLPSLTRYGSFEGGLNLWAVAQTPR